MLAVNIVQKHSVTITVRMCGNKDFLLSLGILLYVFLHFA